MTTGTTLRVRQINHGQSEIWLEADNTAATSKRTLATNEVVNITRRHCPTEVFEAFYTEYHLAVGHVASLSLPNMEELASELKLKQ